MILSALYWHPPFHMPSTERLHATGFTQKPERKDTRFFDSRKRKSVRDAFQYELQNWFMDISTLGAFWRVMSEVVSQSKLLYRTRTRFVRRETDSSEWNSLDQARNQLLRQEIALPNEKPLSQMRNRFGRGVSVYPKKNLFIRRETRLSDGKSLCQTGNRCIRQSSTSGSHPVHPKLPIV
jgi:hypothetical protein